MSTTSLWEDGQLPGLSGPKQAGTALKLARAHLVPMLAIWVAMSLVAAGQTYLIRSLDILSAPLLSSRYLGFTLIGALVNAVFSAVTYRVLLGRRPLGLEGSALAGLGVLVLVGLVPALLLKLAVGVPSGDTSDTQAMMATGLRSLGAFAVILVLAFVWLKLLLWPIGLVVGDPEVTAGVSWKLTHRAYWGYIIGAVLLAAIPYIIVLVITLGARAAGGATSAASAAANVPLTVAPFSALLAIAFNAVAAALFHLRRGPEGDPAGVFD